MISDGVDDVDAAALRQVTFLGLCAPEPDDDGNDDGGASSERNALDARNLSEFLMEIGAYSVSITDADADTDLELPIFDEPSLDGSASLGEWAMVLPDLAAGRNLWRRCDVSAHFGASVDVPSLVEAVRTTFDCPSGPRYAVDAVPDRDWIAHVQESWTPIVTPESKFVLRFPWHDDKAVMAACQEADRESMERAMQKQFDGGVKREGAVVNFLSLGDDGEQPGATKKRRDYVQIRLEGGIAFGTGEHPTTRLCLGWVRDNVERLLESKDSTGEETINFLDYGAGSGVLGIAAAAIVRDRNAQSKRSQQPTRQIATVGVEIDADAIRIADENAAQNGVDMKNYLPDPDSLDAEAASVVLRALHRAGEGPSLRPLPDERSGRRYDLCAANILAGPLLGLAPTIAGLVKRGGRMGLSGVLVGQAEEVVNAYSDYFEYVKVAAEDGGWVLITGERK
ncbi:hypothetical protein ACHAXT_000724 [Thalassiosira profunda]